MGGFGVLGLGFRAILGLGFRVNNNGRNGQ